MAVSRRTIRILSMVHLNENNSDNNSIYLESGNKNEVINTETGNRNEKNIDTRSSPDIFDLENAPIVFQGVDLENNHIIESHTEDCIIEESLIDCDSNIIPNGIENTNWTDNIDLGYIGNGDNDIMNYSSSNYFKDQRIIMEIHETEQTKPLVPYELSSDEEDTTYEPSEKYANGSQECSNRNSSNNLTEQKQEDETAIQTENNAIYSARKRKRKANKNDWIRNKNKRLRMKGEAYLGFTRKRGEKIKQNMPRRGRTLTETCKSKKCMNSKVRYCKEFTEDYRKVIFNKFWNMNWDQRKVYIASHVFKTPTFKKTKEHSRRVGTYSYYLSDGNENLQVCRTMFLNTLDIGYKTIQYWVDNSSYGMVEDTSTRTSTKDVIRRRYTESYKYLGEFFKNLPKLPSHYCRRDTSKLYLEYSFQTMSQLYGVYKDTFCKENGLTPLGRNVFVKTFKENNLALYAPKKDQCNVCFSFKYGNVTELEYTAHIQRKDTARQSKIDDKLKAEKGELIVLTMDVQAVKLCPYLPANKMYFKTKLCCHNFTVYDLKSRNVMCYWFSENQNNDLKASTFTSCIIDYLEENCVTPSKTPIVMYSDGCGYQNRNNTLANALLNFAIKYDIIVYQKYLEPGHTQMECDSVHSVIERSLRYREIHLPSDYASVTTEARKTPQPYGVKVLEYTFFRDFSSQLRYKSLRPGKKVSDPVITDIKCIKYEPKGKIEVKLDYQNDYIELPIRPKTIPPITNYPRLFNVPPKIKTEKWQHLQELKSVLPKDTHSFYDSLLHS